MTRTKVYLILQAALCVLLVALLSASAVSIYREGAARKAEHPLEPIYTREIAPEGREVGQRLPDFALPCYDGSEFHLADQRGKVTFINLWATSCTPCKHELPYFDALYRAHEGDIAMLVVHSSMVLDDPAEYLADRGYAMPFATDDDDDTVAEIVGSTGTFPQTIVLNRRGEVVYNEVGSVTPQMLSALYEQANQ